MKISGDLFDRARINEPFASRKETTEFFGILLGGVSRMWQREGGDGKQVLGVVLRELEGGLRPQGDDLNRV